ncbi:MASE3 domain-containing protein [Azotobacter vinelandii]
MPYAFESRQPPRHAGMAGNRIRERAALASEFAKNGERKHFVRDDMARFHSAAACLEWWCLTCGKKQEKNNALGKRWSGMSLLLAVWGLICLFGGSLPPVKYFLTLHQMVETASIVVSVLIFAVGWHTFRMHGNRVILMVSCTFLGVAISDFSHMLSYSGMPDFLGPNSPEKAIGFWLLARCLTALGVLIIACLPWRLEVSGRSAAIDPDRWRVLLVTLCAMVSIHLVLLLFPEILPRTYQEGVGLTEFKRGVEFSIIAIHAASIVLLSVRRRRDMGLEKGLLICSLLVMMMGEFFFFTIYSDVTDAYNIFGHIYKIIAYLVLYRAIFVESILAPYKFLEDSRQHVEVLMGGRCRISFSRLASMACSSVPTFRRMESCSERRSRRPGIIFRIGSPPRPWTV